MTRVPFLARWTLVNGVGMALGFLAFVNVVFFMAFGLQFDLYWTEPQNDLENAGEILRRALVVGLPLAGAIFTAFQATVLRNYSVDLRLWILAGPIGFVVPLLLIWPLTAIWGDIPGPVEPFTIVGGGLVGTAGFQWWTLRRRGIAATRWLLLWSAGLPLGMVAFMLAYTVIEMVYPIGWAGEVGLIGFAIGCSAAALSGQALLRAVSAPPPVHGAGGDGMADSRARTVSVDGAELHYSTRGSGPTCLVLSSIGSEPYKRLTPPQLAERLRLVYVDLRGSGRSTGNPADLTFEVLAEDLEAIRRELGVDEVAVLGHSILGVLAIEYGRRRPGSVSHVIVVGTPPSGDMAALATKSSAFFEERASEDRKQLLQDNLASLPEGASMEATMHAQTPMRFYDPRFDATPLFAQADPKPGLLRHIMGTLTVDWNIRADSSSLSVPIFIALGRHDYTVPHVLWDGVVDTLPNATRRVFENSGHQPFFEEPAVFADALSKWMADQG